MADYVPDRGDIVDINFDPTKGKEQAHERPALVLTPKKFNEYSGLALLAPITSSIRGNLFEVPFNTPDTKGVVLTHQVRMIDYKARKCTRRDTIPALVLKEALGKVRALVSE